MTQEQVERVARAFYEAEHPCNWREASKSTQEYFRELARMAIITFNHQMAAYWSPVTPKSVSHLTMAS